MLAYAIRRILLAIPTLFGISLVTFTVINLAPGDPASVRADSVMDPRVSARVYEQLSEYYGLDRPLHVRYFDWLRRIVTFDFGNSMTPDARKVSTKIMERLPATLSLALLSLALGFALAIPIGILSGAYRNGWFDTISSTVLYALYAVPSYVMAIPLILWVSIELDLLPFQGMVSDGYADFSTGGKLIDLAQHYVLITFCFTYGALAYQTRFVRQNLLEVFKQDYILTARAKGQGEWAVVFKHAFRNAFNPVFTAITGSMASLLVGSFFVEIIFQWPGIGQLAIQAIQQRDLPMIQGTVLFAALIFVIINLLVDIGYRILDPRVKL